MPKFKPPFYRKFLNNDILLIAILVYVIGIPLVLILTGQFAIQIQIKILLASFGFTVLFLSYLLIKSNRQHLKNREEHDKSMDELRQLHYSEQEKLRNDFYELIKRQDYQQDEFKKTITDIEYRFSRDFERTDSRMGVQTFYLDYKILEVSEFSNLLNSYYKLYKLFYQINSSENEYWEDIELRFKNHPEDILQILSVHTGSSITFKIKTGWIPSIGTKDGDIVIGLPKGALTVVFIGYLLQKMVSFGITTYKDLIDIENTRLENDKLKQELYDMKLKSQNADNETQEKIQKELVNFFNLTVTNNNIKKIEINQAAIVKE